MKEFNQLLQQQFSNMQKSGKLFRVNISGSQVWDAYLNAFDPLQNPIFRDPTSSSHNCNHCKNFIRRYGNIVSINEKFELVSIFNVEAGEEYANSAKSMNSLITSGSIENVFFETFQELNSLPYESCSKNNKVFKLGIEKNVKQYNKEEAEKYGVVKEGEIKTFYHFSLNLDNIFVDKSNKSVEAIMADFRDAKNVFKRCMEEISLDTLNLVKDLILQGSLLNGDAHLFKLNEIIPLKTAFDKLSAKDRDNWCWVTSFRLNIAKFRNELIGVLCTELAEGKELNEACLSWNKRVDPSNYMKATAPITKRQIEEAKKFVEENGYVESFDRRFATIEDIKISEILHTNAGDGKIKNVSIFDSVKSTSTRHKRSEFNGVEEVGIEKFMKDILPGCTSIELFLTNENEKDFVTLTTSKEGSKQIFKWNNPFSWTFNGNLAGKSEIKDNVKAVGGKITGVLRCSLQWNDVDTKGDIDFDLHCKTPYREIYYANKHCYVTGGWLDVDMICPSTIGIENITWQNPLKDGVYKFFVENFSGHTQHNGFKAEIEFDGNVFNYQINTKFRGNIPIADITVRKGVIAIEHKLQESTSSKNLYNLETNEFHKVNLVCLTPNHWGDNNVGNKHYLFMLQDCKSDKAIRSFHNENLLPELAAHRKVLEVLGSTNMLEPTDKQLSGLGFNATVRNEVILRLQGSHKRVIKLKF